MEDYPKTLMEFESRFSNEESCRDYIFQLRWPIGRIHLKQVADASAVSLENAIKIAVEPGSTVLTDGWEAFLQVDPASSSYRTCVCKRYSRRN